MLYVCYLFYSKHSAYCIDTCLQLLLAFCFAIKICVQYIKIHSNENSFFVFIGSNNKPLFPYGITLTGLQERLRCSSSLWSWYLWNILDFPLTHRQRSCFLKLSNAARLTRCSSANRIIKTDTTDSVPTQSVRLVRLPETQCVQISCRNGSLSSRLPGIERMG